MKIFDYSPKNLRNDFLPNLLSEWLRAYETDGIFKFKLDDQVPTKYLDGKYSFILQKNSKRYSEKRPTDIKKSTFISPPFDPSKFNFTKISPNEHLIKLVNLDEPDDYENLIIVNNSPIEIGHSLICPKFNERKNQILDEYSIKLACHILDLTFSNNFLIGFNSIGAYASVNNLHLHLYDIRENSEFKIKHKYLFPIQNVKSAKLIKEGLWFVDFDDYYRPCFSIEFSDYETIEKFAQKVFLITDYLNKNDIPHNVVFVKSDSFKDSKITIKSFIWPKIISHDIPQNEKNLCYAITEMSGHFISPFDDDYENLDEDFIV
ncbi:unnamed protein product, partial [Brachionus calyciflorus]